MNHITMSVFRRLRVRKYDFCKDNFEVLRRSEFRKVHLFEDQQVAVEICGVVGCVSVSTYIMKKAGEFLTQLW